MANTDARFGLKPTRYRSGVAYNGSYREYFVPSTDSTALFIGDPVIKTGTSNTTVVEGRAVGTLSEVTKATAGAGNSITGVVVGVAPVTDESTTYREASTARVLLVADNPDLVFEIQGDSATAAAATDVGNNADLVFTHGGSTVTGLSGVELDVSTVATGATLQTKIIGFSKDIENDATAVNAKYEVIINTHTETQNQAGV